MGGQHINKFGELRRMFHVRGDGSRSSTITEEEKLDRQEAKDRGKKAQERKKPIPYLWMPDRIATPEQRIISRPTQKQLAKIKLSNSQQIIVAAIGGIPINGATNLLGRAFRKHNLLHNPGKMHIDTLINACRKADSDVIHKWINSYEKFTCEKSRRYWTQKFNRFFEFYDLGVLADAVMHLNLTQARTWRDYYQLKDSKQDMSYDFDLKRVLDEMFSVELTFKYAKKHRV